MLKQRHHPDLGGSTETAAGINEAYSILTNPDKRLKYDRKRALNQPSGVQDTGLYDFLKVATHACPSIISRACHLLLEETRSLLPLEEARKKIILVEQARHVLTNLNLRSNYDKQLAKERRKQAATCTVHCGQCGETNYILPEEKLPRTNCSTCGTTLAAVLIQTEVPIQEKARSQQAVTSPQSWMGKVDHVQHLCSLSSPVYLPDFLPYLEDPDGRVRDATVVYLGRRLMKDREILDEDGFLKAFSLSSTAGRPSILRLIPAAYSSTGKDQPKQKKEVRELLRKSLESYDEAIREAARDIFDELFPKKGAIIKEAIMAEGKTVGDVAVMALTFSSDKVRPYLVSYLMGLTLEDVLATRVKGVRLLGRVAGTDAETKLIKLLKDDEWVLQEEAARALALNGTVRSVKPLVSALKNSNQVLREEAVKALGRIASPEAVKMVREALLDPDWRVRMAAETVIEATQPE